MRLRLPPGVMALAVGMLCVAAAGCGGNEFQVAEDGGAVNAGGSGDTGGSPGVDSGTSWCTGNAALFCEDFDEYPQGAAGISALFSSPTWPTFEQTGGSFKFDNTAPPSPPNALDATGTNGAQVIIVKGFAAAGAVTTTIHLEFDLRINAAGSVGIAAAAGFAAIAFGTTISDGYAAIAIAESATAGQQGPTLAAAWTLPADAGVSALNSFKVQNATGSFPTTGQWSGRYALEIDYSGTGASKTGSIQVYQGVTPLLSPPLALPPEFLDPHGVAIALGDYAGGTGNTGAIDVEFDNVTFDEK